MKKSKEYKQKKYKIKTCKTRKKKCEKSESNWTWPPKSVFTPVFFPCYTFFLKFMPFSFPHLLIVVLGRRLTHPSTHLRRPSTDQRKRDWSSFLVSIIHVLQSFTPFFYSYSRPFFIVFHFNSQAYVKEILSVIIPALFSPKLFNHSPFFMVIHALLS